MKKLLSWLVKFIIRAIVVSFVGVILLYLNVILTIVFAPEYNPEQLKVNDVTGLNPIAVEKIIKPTSIEEIQNAVKDSSGAVSIGGGKFSMGGQTASENSVHLDLRSYNQVLSYSAENKELVVQSGATWRDIQEYIDPYNLSVKTMQSYSNFTVGGSISVNCHGRYLGLGAIVHSVKAFKIVLADGSLINASREENPEIFYASIGGYGGLGVITEVTLSLADNTKIESAVSVIKPENYLEHFKNLILTDKKIIMHNADIVPPNYDKLYVTNWKISDKKLTNEKRLQERGADPWLYKIYRFVLSNVPKGERLRPLIEKYRQAKTEVIWRNYEASYDVTSLGQISNSKGSFILQEYFIPVVEFDSFKPKMIEILKRNQARVVNISVRHAIADTNTYLTWSPQDTFAFVLYYYQSSEQKELENTKKWTRELIDEVLKHNGKYYLPYQIFASKEQFKKAYPRSDEYFALKQKLDPTYKFRNKLWDNYYIPSAEMKIAKIYQGHHANRDETQTYLTLPEWMLVFMSEDQADAYQAGHPHSFKYFTAIADYWRTYSKIIRVTKLNYPEINWGYHMMNTTIGVFTTVEYLIKGIYEASIGRLTFDANAQMSEIDKFIGNTYKEYAAFLYQQPWYDFDFNSKYQELLNLSSQAKTLRERERCFSFLIELRIKRYLGSLFSTGTKAVYGDEDLFLYSTIQGDLSRLSDISTEITVVDKIADDVAIIKTPRYAKFTGLVKKLNGFSFLNISGNDTVVTSYTSPNSCDDGFSGEAIYQLKSWSTERDFSRIAKVFNVKQLVSNLNSNSCITSEHVYDY